MIRVFLLLEIFAYLILTSGSLAEELTTQSASVSSCNTVTEQGDTYVVFGPRHKTYTEYVKGEYNDDPNDGRGLKLIFTNLEEKKKAAANVSYQFIYEYERLRHKAVIASKEIEHQIETCPILRLTNGDTVIADKWHPEIIKYYFRYITIDKHIRDRVIFEKDKGLNGGAIVRLKNEDGTPGFFKYELLVNGRNNISAVLYGSTRSARETVKRFSENRRSIKVNPNLKKVSAKDLGYFLYGGTPGNVEPTNEPLSQNGIVAYEFQHTWNDANSWNSNVNEFLKELSWPSIVVKDETQFRLEIDFIESKLFGNNPNGDLLLLCEINFGKGSEKCTEYRQ